MLSEIFESKAGDYESWYSSPRGRRAHESETQLLEWLLQFFPPVRSVLEIGCGTGHFSRWLSGRSLPTIGLDRSARMLAESRKACAGVPLILGDAHRLPVCDNGVDLVLFVTTLEFLTDPAQGVSEAARVARRGLIIVVLNKWSLGALSRRTAPSERDSLLQVARDFSLGALLRIVKKSCGTRLEGIRWQSSLFPNGLYRTLAPLPLGDVIGMALLLKAKPEDDAAMVGSDQNP